MHPSHPTRTIERKKILGTTTSTVATPRIFVCSPVIAGHNRHAGSSSDSAGLTKNYAGLLSLVLTHFAGHLLQTRNALIHRRVGGHHVLQGSEGVRNHHGACRLGATVVRIHRV